MSLRCRGPITLTSEAPQYQEALVKPEMGHLDAEKQTLANIQIDRAPFSWRCFWFGEISRAFWCPLCFVSGYVFPPLVVSVVLMMNWCSTVLMIWGMWNVDRRIYTVRAVMAKISFLPYPLRNSAFSSLPPGLSQRIERDWEPTAHSVRSP